MTADLEAWPPPNEPETFESLCLDLWKEIWGPGSDAAKVGRSGQAQEGVDLVGRLNGRWAGVQCKQKNGLLRKRVSVADLEKEVENARGFLPALGHFTLATTGPADSKVQQRARELADANRARGRFKVEVWDWNRIWREIYRREYLLRQIGPIYWPRLFALRFRPPRVAPSRLTHVAEELIGREAELASLDAAWQDSRINVVTLVAWGGVGKTSLLATWAAGLAGRSYDGADYFDWSFYSQGTREQGGASSDTFVAEALRFFGDPAMAERAASPWDKGARLAQLIAERRALLILDGLEPLQHPPGPLAGQLKDPALTSLLKGLAQRNVGLCAVTTRVRVLDLAAYRRVTAPEWELERLATSAGVRLLKSLGVLGSSRNLEVLVEDVNGHALTLTLLGSYLAKAHGGNVLRRDLVDLQKADRTVQGGHAFKTMAAYERWLEHGGRVGIRQLAILRLMGLFDRPAERGCLDALRARPPIPGLTDPIVGLSEEDWNLACSGLREAHLLAAALPSLGCNEASLDTSTLDAHPLLREHFANYLRELQPRAWRAAQRRLYKYLRDSTEMYPETLEGLQPLYYAVAHGCQAGCHKQAHAEIYRDRILRGLDFFSTKKLGAFGADLGSVACFFVTPWDRVSPTLAKADQSWLLTVAAFNLRALGRLNEALSPVQAGLKMDIALKDWAEAAISASNLSELQLTLGNVPAAIQAADDSVLYADRSGDLLERMAFRTTLADSLYQAGRLPEALTRFLEAEQLKAELQPEHPLLSSLRGFRFCDILLHEVELAVWRNGAIKIDHAALCRVAVDVENRARKSLQSAQELGESLLGIALGYLTLSRIRLYRNILENEEISFAVVAIEQAISGLRHADQDDELPKGLLTRAWLRSLQGDPTGAQSDLAEAQEIAERGPMPLFLADIALYRARLFRDREALAAARALIEKHGYWRRKEEMEDAEEMAKGW